MNNSATNMATNNSNTLVGTGLRTSSYYALPAAPIPTATLEEALALVDASGVVEFFTGWAKEDGRSTRRATLISRQVLAVWIALGLSQRELTVGNAASVLCEHLTPARRRALDLPDGFSSLVPEQVASTVERVTRRLMDAVDAYPSYSRGRRLTKNEWERLVQERAEHSAELEERRGRFVVFANRLLRAQFTAAGVADLGASVSVVVDSCFRTAGARDLSRHRLGALESEGRVSAEPDAGFAVHGGTADGWGQARYGWEDELAVLIPNDPDQRRSVPNIAIGINPHRPGVGFAAAASEMLQNIAASSAGLDHVVVGRAYMATPPAPFRTSLADLGVKLVADYPQTRLGVQRKSTTGLLVDGTWYAPTLPAHLQTAGLNLARPVPATTGVKKREASQELTEQLDARAEFARLHPHAPGASSTEPDEQHYPYRSEQWSKVYSMGRQAFESYAASLRRVRKNTRGGMRGATAQAFLSVLTVMGTNARIIEDFHDVRETPRDRSVLVPRLMQVGTVASTESAITCKFGPRRRAMLCPAVVPSAQIRCDRRDAFN
ncbi:hypothetical protein PQI51_08675 [Microbacterium esteraromaticum]|uniref:hypothetical protein n=1 Tax=Microbacterium esteraromaticum TaxID=57043 RepID=UPI00309BAC6E